MVRRDDDAKRTALSFASSSSKTGRGEEDEELAIDDGEGNGKALVYPRAKPDGLREVDKSAEVAAGMIEITLNDRLGKKVKVSCNSSDTVKDLKMLVAAMTGTRPEKLRI